jgi:flagellar motor switch protein FliN/FliY
MERDDAASRLRSAVRPLQLQELKSGVESSQAVADDALGLVQDVRVRLTMSVGGAQMSIGELFALKEGATLELDKATADPVDIFLDGKLIGRGELMVSGDRFAVRITEIGGKG